MTQRKVNLNQAPNYYPKWKCKLFLKGLVSWDKTYSCDSKDKTAVQGATGPWNDIIWALTKENYFSDSCQMKVRAAITETKGYKVSCCSSQGNKIWHAQQFTYHTESLYLPIEEEKKKKGKKRKICMVRKKIITHSFMVTFNLHVFCLISDKSFKAGMNLVSLIKSFLFSA